MATDIELSSCSSSLVDSGFDSASPPKPPPRRKKSKSTWNLVEKDQEQQLEFVKFSTGRKSSSSAITDFFKNFAPVAKEKIKQSFWTLVKRFGGDKRKSSPGTVVLSFPYFFSFVDDNRDKSAAV